MKLWILNIQSQINYINIINNILTTHQNVIPNIFHIWVLTSIYSECTEIVVCKINRRLNKYIPII